MVNVMYGELFRKWMFFLKKRKLYSKFISDYQFANEVIKGIWASHPAIHRLKLLTGRDYIFLNKNNTLQFEIFLANLRTIDYYSSSIARWRDLGIKFGELNGYIEKEVKPSSISISSFNSESKRTKRIKEPYGKWYDRFNGVDRKNPYRR